MFWQSWKNMKLENLWDQLVVFLLLMSVAAAQNVFSICGFDMFIKI